MRKFTKFTLTLALLFGVLGGVKADPIVTKTPIILTGGHLLECFESGTYGIQMQGWQQFIAYEDATGVEFDEDSYMQFNLAEDVSNDLVRVTFTFEDNSTLQEWWCLGIGKSKDDTSIPYYHIFDNSKYWLKKGLGDNFEAKKTLKIKKVVVQNFCVGGEANPTLVTYKVNGGTICGQPMTIKNDNTKAFGVLSGTFTATTAQTNIFKMENFAVGDNQKIVIKFGAAVPSTGGWKLNNNSGLTDLSGKTECDFNLNGDPISDFTIFNWDANPDPINISEVYFYKEEDPLIQATTIYEAPVGTTDLKNLTGTNTSWNVHYPANLGEAAVLCGDGNGDVESTHVTITGKDYICFEVTEVVGAGQQLRAWIWDGAAGGEGSVKTLYAYPIANSGTATWTTANTVSATGTYVIKVSGYNYLKGIKTNYGGAANSIVVSQAYVCSGDNPTPYTPTGKYVLVGETTGSASLAAALADANATFYDATNVTGTGVDLTGVANPNALFKANADVLANTKNVIVGSTCANLELTDGKPFKAPVDFTATAAKFTKTVSDAGYATMVIPFGAALPTGVEAYNLTGVTGESITYSTAATIAADKPVLIKAAADDYEFTASGAAVTATADGVVTNGLLKGGYATMTAAADANNYVLQNNANGVNFYLVTGTPATVKPFRAYLTTVGGARALSFDFNTTGVNQVKVNSENAEVYNLNGQRVAAPQKGLYIVGGKKVIVK